MKKIFSFLFFIGVVFIATPTFAQQEEKILEYRSDIVVNSDTTIDITEKITFQPSTTIPRHGLEWTIPYVYSVGAFKRPTKLDIKMIKYFPVSDSSNTIYNKYSRTDENGWATLRIGNPDRYISGAHVYLIQYKLTYTGISYFDEWEEVYLNIIGPGWNIPIENASATLTLPSTISEAICYTGKDKNNAQNCEFTINGNTIDVKPNTTLTAYEGYSVAIKQPLGTFEDTTKQQALIVILSNIGILLPIPVGIFLFLFLKKKFKNPSLTVIPEYKPMEELDVLTAALVIKPVFNTKNISAVLIEMAVKGFYTIKEYKKNKYEFVKSTKDYSNLPSHLNELLSGIFKKGDSVKIDKLDTFYLVANKSNSLALKELNGRGYFSIKKKNSKTIFALVPLFLFFIVFNSISIFISFSILGWFIGILISLILFFIFSFMIDTRSEIGNKVYHQLLGLKMYIQTAEKEKIKFHSDPKKYKEVFETLLPYAMIFNLEKQWSEQFKDLYKTPPEWYQGNFDTFNTVYLANSLSKFNSSVRTSSSSPSSSYSSSRGHRSGGWSSGGSGFSGGSSGGGGGGSGGGGW